MKMSDYFASKLTLETSAGEGFLLKDAKCEYDEEYLAFILELRQAKAITHAINNHDRLTEENAKLREMLENLTESASVNEEQLNDLLMCGDYGESKALCDAKQLLNQLKEQNNDNS